MHTLRLHYSAVLYNADTILTWSPRCSQIFLQYTVCENISRRSRYTQCKLWKSFSLCISKHSLTPVNLPRGGVNVSLDIQCLRYWGSCVIERSLSNFCLQNKTSAASGKRASLWQFLQHVYLTTRRSTSLTVWLLLLVKAACAWTVSIFRTLTYMQVCFRHQNKPFCRGIGMK